MSAIYRVSQGWSPREAAAEMTEGGFGFHPIWRDLVAYVLSLSPDAMRKPASSQVEDSASEGDAEPTH
jgi:hypothetical protein